MLPEDDPHRFGMEIAQYAAQAIRCIQPGAANADQRLASINGQVERSLQQAAQHRREAGMCEPEAEAWLASARAGWAEGMKAETGFLKAEHDAPARAQ